MWLTECSEDHPSCLNSPPDKLPTRHLDVGLPSDPQRVRLVETVQPAGPTEYTTLSHCWGKQPLIKLTKENYSAFQEEIPATQLPLTFSEAINFTRRLGKQYIWIDALCIIQDSPDDWIRESATMAQVYSGSFLNICATASPDGQGGLYRQRDPLAAASCVIRPSWPKWDHDPLVCYDQDGFKDDVC